MPRTLIFHLDVTQEREIATAKKRDRRPEVRQRATAVRLLAQGEKPAAVVAIMAVSEVSIACTGAGRLWPCICDPTTKRLWTLVCVNKLSLCPDGQVTTVEGTLAAWYDPLNPHPFRFSPIQFQLLHGEETRANR